MGQVNTKLDQGKSLFLKDEDAAAIACFDEFIRLNPNNDEGYAWRARARHVTGDQDGCQKDVETAIRLNPSCAIAYFVRAKLWQDKGNTVQAISDVSKAIELDPSQAVFYRNRGQYYERQGDFTHAIPDYLRGQQDGNPNYWIVYSPEDSKYKLWCDLAYKHFVEELLPKAGQSGEIVLGYWPATFYWGETEHYQHHVDSERMYIRRSISSARGYFCITNSSLHIVLRSQITKKHPIKGPGCLASIFSIGFLDEHNKIEQEKNDKVITLSHRASQGVELSNDEIIFRTSADTWRIIPLFGGAEQYIYVALSLASEGQLIPTTVEPSSVRTPGKQTSTQDFKAALKSLAELKAEGLISEDEYETKKREILGRI